MRRRARRRVPIGRHVGQTGDAPEAAPCQAGMVAVRPVSKRDCRPGRCCLEVYNKPNKQRDGAGGAMGVGWGAQGVVKMETASRRHGTGCGPGRARTLGPESYQPHYYYYCSGFVVGWFVAPGFVLLRMFVAGSTEGLEASKDTDLEKGVWNVWRSARYNSHRQPTAAATEGRHAGAAQPDLRCHAACLRLVCGVPVSWDRGRGRCSMVRVVVCGLDRFERLCTRGKLYGLDSERMTPSGMYSGKTEDGGVRALLGRCERQMRQARFAELCPAEVAKQQKLQLG
jgi:hypothetical protein